MKKKYTLFLIFIILLYKARIFTQEPSEYMDFIREPKITDIPIIGYRNINLGMTRKEVIDIINKDPLMMLPRKYLYGDVDINAEESANFIALQENRYFRSGYFLFKNDSLYSITIRFQENQIDFLEILNTLNNKYGLGEFTDASTIAWINGNNKLILERPTIVKYFLLSEITNVASADTNINLMRTRQSLLDGL